jgi:hypothetical protein
MDENIIAWNVTNWVTVILMAAIGFFLLGLALKWKQSKSAPVVGSTNTTQAAV